MSSIAIDRAGFLANVLLAQKGPCRVGTTGSIVLSGEQTIDGVSVVANDRVLVKDQDDTKENGVWAVKTGAWERVQDLDQRGHVVRGTWAFITDGTTLAESVWYVTTTGRPRPGFEAVEFEQFQFGAQPLDADLTAIAALATTSFGRSLLTLANAAAGASAFELDTALLDADIGNTVQAFDADTLKADTPDTLTVGFDSTSYNIGTVSTGTLTPASSNGNFQHAINNGSHTLAAPTNPCSIVIEYTNSTAPGTITATAYGDYVSGSPSTGASLTYQAAILKTSTIASLTWVTT